MKSSENAIKILIKSQYVLETMDTLIITTLFFNTDTQWIGIVLHGKLRTKQITEHKNNEKYKKTNVGKNVEKLKLSFFARVDKQ